MAEDDQPGPCRLLALPRELRDLIYEFTFSDFEVQINGQLKTSKDPSVEHCNAGLTLACKQIHHESIKAYYMNTPFFSLDDVEFRHWILKLPATARKSLKHVKVVCLMRGPCQNYSRSMTWEEQVRSEILWDFRVLGIPVEVELVPWTGVVDRLGEMRIRECRLYGGCW